jgi:hypothetical protein
MVIGLAGRMRAGKSELAKVCEDLGYKKLYFALPLKQLCADLLDISIEGLNEAKNKGIDIGVTINEDMCKILADETEIPLDIIMEKCNGKLISTVRQMLQFIGTDLIREYNKDWHVNKIRAMINPNENYVIDDVRFKNEKALIEELGGDCWFVTRTSLENISNHESETSLTWHDCWNRIIINDNTVHYLLFKWGAFMDNYERSCAFRDKEFNRILENGAEGEITKMSTLDMLMLSKDMFTYTPIEFDKEAIKTVEMLEDNGVKITYNDDTYEFVYNALNIEDLKMIL